MVLRKSCYSSRTKIDPLRSLSPPNSGWFTLRRDSLSKLQGRETKTLVGNFNGADYSTPVEVEQRGESSTMAGSRDVVGGGFVFDYPISTSEETKWNWQNERGTELNFPRISFSVVTYDSHVPSIPLRKHQRPTTLIPAPTETTDSASPQSPADRLLLPQIPIDPALLEIDAIFSSSVDPAQSMRDAERILREMRHWHESPKPSD
ncbi:hypothetical protein MMC22_002352 [Lobaria immixta]|nr:hypothetical protein [Lobaria immixta]